MTPEQKEKLLHLKAKQQQKIKDAEVEMTKKRIVDNIHDFSAKYRFALPDETPKITTLITNLPYSQPGKIDFSLLPASTLTQHNTIWICFLTFSVRNVSHTRKSSNEKIKICKSCCVKISDILIKLFTPRIKHCSVGLLCELIYLAPAYHFKSSDSFKGTSETSDARKSVEYSNHLTTPFLFWV